MILSRVFRTLFCIWMVYKDIQQGDVWKEVEEDWNDILRNIQPIVYVCVL